MEWLAVPIGCMLLSWFALAKGNKSLDVLSRLAFFTALLLWLWQLGNIPRLGDGEEGLLRWFAWGLGIAILAEGISALDLLRSQWEKSLLPLLALFYALGFDVLRPDAYATQPAIILALLVVIVAARVIRRLLPALEKRGMGSYRFPASIYVLAVALLQYSAFYKLMDRGWVLPWSYVAAAGAVFFALSQLWLAWDRIVRPVKANPIKIRAAYQIGNILIIAAALFHYRQYF